MLNICFLSERNLYHQQVENVLKNNKIQYSMDLFSSKNEIIDLIQNHTFKYHCFIIDIHDESLLTLVKDINDRYYKCHVIYIADNLEVSRFISHTYFSYFIYLDDIDKELPKAITKAVNKINESTMIQIPLKGKTKIIELNNIVYIESHLHKINIVCLNETVECYKKLNDLSKIILSYPQFLRCHNSYIVNMDYIKEFGSTSIVMNNDVNITITRKYKEEVKEYLNQYYNPFLKI